MKTRIGVTHFLTKTLPTVAAEMALSVLAHNLIRFMNIEFFRRALARVGDTPLFEVVSLAFTSRQA